jgi:hypothetical protein
VTDHACFGHVFGEIKAVMFMLVFALLCVGNGRAFDANQINKVGPSTNVSYLMFRLHDCMREKQVRILFRS